MTLLAMLRPMPTLLKSGIGLLWAMGMASLAAAQAVNPSSAELVGMGQRIYTEGALSDGRPLTGVRMGNIEGQGGAVACIQCHRSSGLGQVEGGTAVPPIAGKFLFSTRASQPLVNMDPRVSKMFNQTHDPYTEHTLATALTEGVTNHGKTMSAAMPRYQLGDTDRMALMAYLRQLSADWSPGVTNSSIRLASVITPDVEPQRRQVFKEMMQRIVRQKNGSTHPASELRTRHHMTSAAEMVLGTERKWELDIWELEGPADTWAQQLAEFYRKKPVFALVSGVANQTWQPVHDFCEQERLPCWFPSLKVAVSTVSQYGLYFSEGVNLEARAVATHLLAQSPPLKKVLQVYRNDTAGPAAASALSKTLEGSPIKVESRALRSDVPREKALREALGTSRSDSAVVFWLAAQDIEALDRLQPVGQVRYFSANFGLAENTQLPLAWRAQSYLVSPYALPAARAAHLTGFNAWRNLSGIPLVDEAMQSEVFFALNFLTDTLSEMLENYYRDYLVERAETMLSLREGSKVEQEARDRRALGGQGELEKRHGSKMLHDSTRMPLLSKTQKTEVNGTTVYPRLSLGPGQRYASKGAYLVQFPGSNGIQNMPEPEWIVPP
jgi:mono/diheme cytochrome c family protein